MRDTDIDFKASTTMRSGLGSLLTAVVAVAGAAVIALVLAEHTTPEPLQLAARPAASSTAQPVAKAPRA
jgi:hypothetical protein